MFGSLRSLWIFVDPTSDKPNVNEDDFTYDDAENEIIMLTNTEETIPAGMRHNKKNGRAKFVTNIFVDFLKEMSYLNHITKQTDILNISHEFSSFLS